MQNRELKITFFNLSGRLFRQRLASRLLALFLILGLGLVFSFAHAPAVLAADTDTDVSGPTCTDAEDPESCEAFDTLNAILNFMATLVLPLVSIMIIVGGIQYSMAGNNPEALKNARARIFKAIAALIIFIAMWSFLKWLIPGGLE